MNKLKDCPCCGGEAALLTEDFGKTVFVGCTECGLHTARYDKEYIVDGMDGEKWAVWRWNMRVFKK